MKKLLFVALSATLLFSCNKGTTDGYVIEGTIENLETGEAYLEVINEFGDALVTIDTTNVENGKFTFKGKAEDIEFAFIQFKDVEGKVRLILENEKMSITAYKDSINASKASGSYNNVEFYKFGELMRELQEKQMNFQQENMATMLEAQQNQDTIVIAQLNTDFQNLQDDVKNTQNDYVSENPKSFVSLLVLSELINNPREDASEINNKFEALSSELKNSKTGKKLSETIAIRSKLSVGRMAPDFSAPNPEGEMVSLKESLGKVTLIDFWASWCGPCRKENPHVVALYNEFHEKGLNIIGVSLDREDQKEKWLEAIATDKLTWTQVSNLQFWQDPIAKQYNITSIPATFLLDENGRIIAKNLRGNELRAKVAEVLGE